MEPDDLAGRLDAVLVTASALADKVEAERQLREAQIAEERQARKDQADRDDAARKRSNRRFTFALLVIALLAWFGIRQNNDRVDDIVAVRKQGRAATCTVFQAYTDALAGGAHPATEEERAQAQARADKFVAGLNSKLSVIDCTLVAPQIAAPTGGSAP